MASLQLRARLSLWFGFFGSAQARRSSRRAPPDQSRLSMERLKLGAWTWRLDGVPFHQRPSQTRSVVRHSAPDLSPLRPDSPRLLSRCRSSGSRSADWTQPRLFHDEALNKSALRQVPPINTPSSPRANVCAAASSAPSQMRISLNCFATCTTFIRSDTANRLQIRLALMYNNCTAGCLPHARRAADAADGDGWMVIFCDSSISPGTPRTQVSKVPSGVL